MKTYKQAVEMLAEQKTDLELNGSQGDIFTEASVVADIYDVVLEQVLADVDQAYNKILKDFIGA